MRLAAAAAALKRQSEALGGVSRAPFSLAFLTDRRRVPQPEPILTALPAGAAVIYRDYDDPKRAATARRYAAICRRRGVLFLVAGDEALARAVGADGVHWPARALFPAPPFTGKLSAKLTEGARSNSTGGTRGKSPLSRLRRQLPRFAGGAGARFLITAACHNAEELALAHAASADLALLSPVFATASHPDTDYLGAAAFRALAAASPVPVLALGGVDETNARLVVGRNVAGLAAIGAFLAAG